MKILFAAALLLSSSIRNFTSTEIRLRLILLLCFAATACGKAASYTANITSLLPSTNSPGWLSLSARVPSNSIASLEMTSSLSAHRWTAYAPPVFAPPSGVISFQIPGELEQGQVFFRVKAVPFEIEVDDDGKQIVLETTNNVPLGALLDALKLGDSIGIFPMDDVNPFSLVPPLRVAGANIEEVLRQAGIPAWVTPATADDSQASRRLLGNTNFQSNPLPIPPGQRGTNRLEDGFAGDPSLPVPTVGPTNPPPPGLLSAKPFDPNLGPDTTTMPQRERPTTPGPARHVRLLVELGVQGGATAVGAVQAPEDALLDYWPSELDTGALVYVVRSPLAATAPGNVYFIGARYQPFEIRVYHAPDGTPHGTVQGKKTSLRVPVPVLPTDTSLAGLTVQFYVVTRALRGVTLTPEEFLRRSAELRLLGSITGGEINPLLAAPRVLLAGGLPPPTITPVHLSGSKAKKYNIGIIAEGYANTAADQAAFNNYVNDQILGELFSRDIHPSILNAINVYRINTFSQDSGVTQTDPNDGHVITPRDTALDVGYNGSWGSLWFDLTQNTEDALYAIWQDLLPEIDLMAIVVNESDSGGVAGGTTENVDYLIATAGSGWDTFAHEMGHAIGSLADEYYCYAPSSECDDYSGEEPGAVNQTAETTPSQIKWKNWIPPWRPLPTSLVGDMWQDAGLFPGATRGTSKYWNGIYRPTFESRMGQGTGGPFNPVGYERMREKLRPYQEADLRKNASGDFDGDGKADVVVLDDRQLSLYLSRDRNVGPDDPVTGAPPRPVTGVLEPVWYLTGTIPNSANGPTWSIRSGDKLFPADFDGDGRTDLFVVNLSDWIYPYFALLRSTGASFEPAARYTLELPGWDDMREHDEFYVADFNHDGRDDLMVFNGLDWDKPYFILLRSTGTALAYVRRYDRFLPDGAWVMGPHEKFLIGDFNGDDRKDVAAWNRLDWAQVTLQMFTSTGTDLDLAEKHFGVIAYLPFPLLNFSLRNQDQLIVLDFNGDGRDDLAVFNGINWQTEYLGLFTSSAAAKLEINALYADAVPGWDFEVFDTFRAADVNGDGNEDLIVFNAWSWSTEYLGILRISSTQPVQLQGSWQADRIGGWNLSYLDSFRPAEFRGASGWTDLFVFNKSVFGLLRSQANSYQAEAIYPYHIHNHRYQRGGLW
jgi:hypothetical protein